ncbi:hypothetical protein EV192_106391 [Actinocrispum wychmicini]|uniref:SH3 domain-containing protein n=1 Tax=Actinocrispum wychmicini TaxID=1213861 RepID=A0A4R2JIT2_9PSEU|nr:hypothetical protein EV192_106391 [Actinocrispum wychmicini]
MAASLARSAQELIRPHLICSAQSLPGRGSGHTCIVAYNILLTTHVCDGDVMSNASNGDSNDGAAPEIHNRIASGRVEQVIQAGTIYGGVNYHGRRVSKPWPFRRKLLIISAVAALVIGLGVAIVAWTSNPLSPLIGNWERTDLGSGHWGDLKVYPNGTTETNIYQDGKWKKCAGQVHPAESKAFRFDANCNTYTYALMLRLPSDGILTFDFGDYSDIHTEWRKLGPGDTPPAGPAPPELSTSTPPPDRTCRVIVAADVLVVRTEPSAQSERIGSLRRDAEIPAEKDVVNGYRRLSEGHWVQEAYVRPLLGADC